MIEKWRPEVYPFPLGRLSGGRGPLLRGALPNAVIDPLGLPWAKDLPFIGADDPASELGFADGQTPPVVDFRERGHRDIGLVSNCLQ